MRILVIGGTKFIGPYVVRELAGHGHDITVFHRGQTEADLPSAVRHVHDASASIPVRSFPPDALDPMPDVVIHMVPMGERLALLPPSDAPLATVPANFEQDIVYDTTRIRRELGFVETVDDADGLRRTMASNLPK